MLMRLTTSCTVADALLYAIKMMCMNSFASALYQLYKKPGWLQGGKTSATANFLFWQAGPLQFSLPARQEDKMLVQYSIRERS